MENQDSEHNEQLTPLEQLTEKPKEFLIVGIGASAGGIQALQEFFRNVPEDSGIAYVVILHLSPDHDSQLAHVLQRETKIPVKQVMERTHIEPNHIYVVPPDRHLTMEDGFIAVTQNLYLEERRAPVDIFFRTLADTHGPRAISVILSGTGANGSMGLKRIKERGGATFVQNPRETEFSEMARNAITTEMVDDVLNVADIPAKIIAYKNSIGKVQIVEEPEQRPEEQQHALREIFTLLRQRTGHDFSNYKRPTLLRRIERRINVRNLPDLPTYAKFLQENSEEPTALLKDLLISVTNFYRDKKAFDVIEQEIIPLILKGKKSEDQVRIWVAGCATGEEAYSIAMLCAERTMGVIEAPKVQIFATDIDDAAIAQAREGYYTINDLADVSAERLRRFFNKEGDGYRIRREIRETVMFALHNFIKDPPFSRLDLVSCRNVMIYLNQVAQERVVETFHFALNPGSYLFLGNSESVDGASDLYAIYHRDSHIFQSRHVAARAYPIPDSVPAIYFDKPKTVYYNEEVSKPSERISFGELHQQLLEEYAAPSLVVNEEYDIVHLTEKAGKYLQIGGGEPSNNLLKIVKPELRLELRSALYHAVQQQSPVMSKGLRLTINNQPETINIHIRPVFKSGDTARGFILIVFEPTIEEEGKELLFTTDEPVARQLEEELNRVKTQLRAANEQHDFQAEEMKASNEELQAINEELRSAAEELETSKEELQSINEELRTVNQELKVKIEETSIASNNLKNLINSTNIGTIFLDRSFRVVLFTPAIREIFNLRSGDYGRPLTDITSTLEYEDLLHDAEFVLGKLKEVEQEVRTKNGSSYLMRMTPYRTDEDRIKGVVITFLDVTERIKLEAAKKASEEKYRTLFNSIDEGFHIIQLIYDDAGKAVDYRYQETNNSFERHTGLKNAAGKSGSEIAPNTEDYWFEAYANVARTGVPVRFENYNEFTSRWYSAYAFPASNENPSLIAVLFNDITERKQREQQQEYFLKLNDALRPIADAILIEKAVTETALNYFAADRCYYCTIAEEIITIKRDALRGDLPSVSGTYPLSNFALFKKAIDDGRPLIVPDSHTTPILDEGLREIVISLQIKSYIVIPVVKSGKTVGLFCLVQSTPRNWTQVEVDVAAETAERTWAAIERANAEEALRRSEERLQLANEAADVGTFIYYPGEDRGEPDAKMLALYGLPQDGVLNLSEAIGHIIHPDDRQRYADAVSQAINPEGNGKLDADIRIIHPDGSVHWMNVTAQTIFEEGKAVRMPGVSIDITERKKAEEALQKSEHRLQRMVNVPQVGVLTFDYNENMLHANDAFLKMVGYSREEFEAKQFTWREFTPPEHMQASLSVIEQLEKTGVGGPYEKEYYRKDGSKIWMMFVAADMGDGTLVEYAIDISERKLAEEGLRKSEAQLRALVENLPGGAVFIVDKDLRYLLAEGEALTNAGAKPEDFLGKTVNAVISPEIKDVHAANYRKALAGEPFELEHEINDRTYISRGVPLINTKGEVYAVLAISYDITQRKQAEEDLRISEERLRITMESAVDYAIITMNTERLIERWNTGAERIFGFTAEETKGKTADIIFTEEDQTANVPEQEMQTAKREGYAEDERWHKRKDGSRFYVSGVMRPIYDGKLSGYVKIARDMTQQQQAQEQLRVFEERNRVALQSAEMASWDWNVREDRIIWNEQHHIILGLEPDSKEKNAAYFIQFVHPDDTEKIEKALKEAVEITGVYKAEFRIIRADNNEARWMTGFGRAIEWDDKRASRMVGVMFDITERKKLEQQKNDFIGIASHELQTPVTSIKAYAELLYELFQDTDDTANAGLVKKLDTQVDRLIDLIHALLDTTKISEGQLALNPETFDLGKLLEERVEDLQRLSEIHRLVFSPKKEIIITADRDRIGQVLTNLISNAIKYSPEGRDVTIAYKRTKNNVEVSVRDRGIGIPQEVQEKVFDRFFRVKNVQVSSYPGMGLGLYITANIVHRHGGTIRVESKQGKGSVFYFTLPVNHKQTDDEKYNND